MRDTSIIDADWMTECLRFSVLVIPLVGLKVPDKGNEDIDVLLIVWICLYH